MISYKLKLPSICLGALISLVTSSLAWSDDTEIFFGGAASGSSTIRPNVLFVLDTSSSMTSVDGGSVNRLDRMKEALRNILNDSNNINVGLMRFSNPGGALLYPVSNIDEVVSTVTQGSVSARIAESADDAEQLSTGEMTLDNTQLSLNTIATGGSSGASIAISRRIQSGTDDAEQKQNNSMYLNSSDLELMKDGSDTQKIGLRFDTMAIPVGATIESAELVFTVDEKKSGAIAIEISGELADTGTFDSDSKDVTNRTRTSASVLWSMVDSEPPVNDLITSDDITSIVQEIVNNGAWAANNAITLILERDSGSGLRTVESYEGDASEAALLNVTYNTGPAIPGTPAEQTVGLRFQTVLVPQGATVTSAVLNFTVATPSSGLTSMTLKGEGEDNSAAFTTTNSDITTRSPTSAAVSWSNADDWTVADEIKSSPDVTSIVQEIVSRGGWCGGNAMTILIKGLVTNTASRYPYTYDDSPSNAPELQIEYDPSTVPAAPLGCLAKEYTARISSSTDDAEETSSGSMSLTSSDLELVNDGNDQKVGMRFTNMDLAHGAVITNAYIEFTTDETTTTATSLTIKGQDTDSANTFTSTDDDISDRTLTSSSVAWTSVSAWSTEGAVNRTPDLKTIVQEIVDRTGWAEGNDMAFVITGSGKRVAESYNGSSGQAARLVVWAESSGGASSTTRTVRDELLDLVDEIQYKSGTPIVDTLYEAALYYRGEDVDYGLMRGGSSSSRREHTRVSHADSYTGGTLNQPSGCTDENLSSTACRAENISGTPTYESPITEACQTNHIILLSDGSPSVNTSASKVRTMAGLSGCADSGSAACGPELSAFLYNEDQTALSGDQTIKTYTIGFNFTGSWLRSIATGAGGTFYEAASSADLTDAFESIFREMLQTDTTYVSPGVTINSFTRLTHRNELYYSLFKPDENPLWSGNLKRYKLQSNADIIDANSNAAVDTATGFFKSTAQSFWSSVVDGSDVTAGGAAENLPTAALRKIYTYYSSSSSTNLSNGVNAFSDSNTALTKTLLGIGSESDAYRTDLVNWSRGVDVLDADNDFNTTEDRNQLSDPLHSRPHLITYGGTNLNPDITVYYGDNMGFLHAIDADTGEELFSFIPELLLPNLDTLYTNSSADSHLYGIDGAVSSWVKDVDGDSTIDPLDGDHAHLYFGLRRGGNNYYALDVTDRSNPTVLWTIEGGSGDFGNLAQTWSRPVNTVVTIGNTQHDVLIFTGGYDADQDDVSVRTPDNEGGAIYMVDASTGALLWSAGTSVQDDTTVSDMIYSIPSSVKAIDVNNDGQTDQFYVGDMGGQLWRFDITHGNNVNSLVSGGVIADISGSSAADNRRFYHAPDISVVVSDAVRKLAITFGSGWQAHPLDTGTENRFYAMFSEDVTSAPASYIKYTESDFYNATLDTLDVGSDSAQTLAQAELDSKQGWYIKLENAGEKVLSSSTTSSGTVYFTTYEPTPSGSSCIAQAGTPRLYKVNVSDATATEDLDNSGDTDNLTKNDRSYVLRTAGLPPEPARLKVKDADGTTRSVLCVGTECEAMDDSGSITKTYWTVEE